MTPVVLDESLKFLFLRMETIAVFIDNVELGYCHHTHARTHKHRQCLAITCKKAFRT